MDVQAAAGGMEPQPRSVGNGWKLLRTVHIDSIARFHSVKQFADVYMSMALSAGYVSVHGHRPRVVPDFVSFGDRALPHSQPLGRAHARKRIGAVVPDARQDQPA